MLMLGTSFINAQDLPGVCLFQNFFQPSFVPGPDQAIESKNGWVLPTSGELRVLVIYIEIDYDLHPGNDPIPAGTSVWPVGQLPNYKDNLFDVNWTGSPQRLMTRYYDECSFGSLIILGDYINNVITVKESDIGNVNAGTVLTNAYS